MPSRFRLPAFMLGLASLVTQTVLLREFLSVFQGNELVLGVVLANWLLLTGIGAAIGRFIAHAKHIAAIAVSCLLVLAILPLLTVIALPFLRNLLFPVGTMLGIAESISGSFILLLPFCLVSGCTFTIWAHIASANETSNRIAEVYAFESLGSVAGGIGFSLLLVFVVTATQALILLGVLLLLVVLIFSIRAANHALVFVGAVGLLFFPFLALNIDLDRSLREALFPKQSIVTYRDTPYGKLTVTTRGGQLNFFENAGLLFSSGDVASREEAVHFAMIQHPDPRRVLLIGGGISGTTTEILKHGVDRIDYAEIDPEIISIGAECTGTLTDARIHPIARDGRVVVRDSSGRYDVVLVNVPDPYTAQLHRYYTIEFFREVHRALRPGGVAAFSLSSSGEYQGQAARRVSSVLYRTLSSAFNRVLVIPGIRNYFIASDGILGYAVTQCITERGISTAYVNRDYLNDDLLADRGIHLMGSLDMTAMVNTDFAPIAYARQLDYWSSLFDFDPRALALAALIGAFLLVSRLDAVRIGMFTGGCAASSLQFLILLSFQILYGYVYQALGFLVATFMAGLGLGAFWGRRWSLTHGRRTYATVQFCVAAFALVLVPLNTILSTFEISFILGAAFLFLLALIVGGGIGLLFSLASRLVHGNPATVASSIYSIDLAGSAFGVLMVSAFLVPPYGIHMVNLLVAGMMVVSALATVVTRNVPIGIDRRKHV